MKKVIKLLSTNWTSDEVPIIFILDCCRLELGLAGSRSVVGSHGSAEIKGLSNLGSAANICIMYSTARGYLASDGGEGSENGAYTKYLLKHLPKVGTISELSTNVRRDLFEDPRYNKFQVRFKKSFSAWRAIAVVT